MDLLLKLQPGAATTLYRQVVEQLREAIIAGRLAPGLRMPSSRDLATVHGISRNTVISAYQQLVAEGYLEGRDRSGHYVSPTLPDSAPVTVPGSQGSPAGIPPLRLSRWAESLSALEVAGPDRLAIDFRSGFDPHTFPLTEWRRHLARAMEEILPAMDYADAAGYPPLRAAIADYVTRSRGAACTPEQVIVTTGARQGYDLVLRTLLEPGDGVAMEEPGYRGMRQSLAAAGAQIHAIPVDDRGMQVAALEQQRGLRLVYVTPSNQFPTAVTLDLARRLTLLEWCRRTGALILEDDYDGEFRYDGHPLQCLQGLDGGHSVIYVGSFAKSLAPALRIGFLIVPEPLIAPMVRAKWIVDRQGPVILQAALASFITSGGLERHLRRMRTRYGQRRTAFLGALARLLPGAVCTGVKAGMHAFVTLPGVRSLPEQQQLVEQAAARGVGLYPVGGNPLEPGRFIFFFAHLSEPQMEAGLRQVAALLAP